MVGKVRTHAVLRRRIRNTYAFSGVLLVFFLLMLAFLLAYHVNVAWYVWLIDGLALGYLMCALIQDRVWLRGHADAEDTAIPGPTRTE